ncbi:MAG: ornithine cyclodeaminase [Alphaproteobacteria bacterium]|nr:ornithine cyclodeaminase [Alphaproteobacteria bacterium]
MQNIPQISARDVNKKLNWTLIANAIEAGHHMKKAIIGDTFINRGADTLLSRSAWIDGVGFGVKSVSVMPNNAQYDLPSIHGAMLIFDDKTGIPIALIDSDLVTKWKTAGDSVLGARMLARPDSKSLLIVGAGSVAENLILAYSEIFPYLRHISIWNRTQSHAEQLAHNLKRQGFNIKIEVDLPKAVSNADIISTATMAHEPILFGDWVKAGTHIDLIGAFKADMREADDDLLKKARIFVDSRDTTIEHIGELMIPLRNCIISKNDILGDFYDLVKNTNGRLSSTDITLFKNGGGAHLDLMTAMTILDNLV